jgi:hypothetical protein
MAGHDELVFFRANDGLKTFWTVTSSGRVCLWHRDAETQANEDIKDMAHAPDEVRKILQTPTKAKSVPIPCAYFGSSKEGTKKLSVIRVVLEERGVVLLDWDTMILDPQPNLHQYQSHDQLLHWYNNAQEKDITISKLISTYICCLFVISLRAIDEQ